MKIIFTVATYYPRMDGVQMVTQYQAEGLAKKGHEVVVITSCFDGLEKTEVHNGVQIVRVDAFNYYYWHKGNKKEYRDTVLTYTKDADALIAVCLQSFSADWLLGILDQISCPKILYLHGMPDFKVHMSDFRSMLNVAKVIFRNARWGFFYKTNFKRICKFDAVTHLFVNDNSYTYFEKHGYKHNYVLQNACSESFFENEVPMSPQIKRFIYVGNYCARKNQALAMRAFYETQMDLAELILIGSQKNAYCEKLFELRSQLEQEYGKKKVEILSNLPREEIVAKTQSAYACIMSSNYEYYPLTIIEAMASGKPFISTDVGIVRYLPGGVIANNKKDLKYWMETFYKNPDMVTELGKIGQSYAEQNMRTGQKVEELQKIIEEIR